MLPTPIKHDWWWTVNILAQELIKANHAWNVRFGGAAPLDSSAINVNFLANELHVDTLTNTYELNRSVRGGPAVGSKTTNLRKPGIGFQNERIAFHEKN